GVNSCQFDGADAGGGDGRALGIFSGNGLGGAIYNADGATLIITNSLFQNNFAAGGLSGAGIKGGDGRGGAIYEAGGYISISGTLFSSNQTQGGSSTGIFDPTLVGNSEGGAIFVAGGSFAMINSTLDHNLATQWTRGGSSFGGGIYVAGGHCRRQQLRLFI